MKIAGQYVGLGLGDSSDEVRKIKAFMRPKFSYAKGLADTPLFDAVMTTAVAEMQKRYNAAGKLASGKCTPGIINAETKYVMGFLPRPTPAVGPDRRPILFTVCGTGVPWWVGPDADTARAVERKYRWQPIGYPAAPFPMGSSINNGKEELRRQIELNRAVIEQYNLQCAFAIYSQGAVIGSEVWEQDIKPVGGRLNWFKKYLTKTVAWGNPNRELGQVWPDFGGSPMATTTSMGVSSFGMRDTPGWWRNYAHGGDLYAATEPGKVQQDKNAIWQIIRDVDFFTGPDSLLAQVVIELPQNPVPDTIAAFTALIDAGMFIAKQTGPHVDYGTQPAIDYLLA